MRSSYMPDKQNEAVDWSANFAEMLGNQPEIYGLSTAQGNGFVGVNAALQIAYAAVLRPETKNTVSVARKTIALRDMKIMARDLVSIIQGTPGVSDDQKLALGLTVRSGPTTIPVPRVAPVLKVTGVAWRTVTVELLQSATRRSKPAGVASAMVFTHLGPVAPMSMDQWQYAMTVTKSTLELSFPPSDTGDTCHITAFWCNAKGQNGPAARPASVNLPAGGVMPVEARETPRLRVAA